MGHPAMGDIATHMGEVLRVRCESSRKDLLGGWDKAKPQKGGSPECSSPEPAAAPEYLRGQSPALVVPCCAVLCRATPCRAAVRSTVSPQAEPTCQHCRTTWGEGAKQWVGSWCCQPEDLPFQSIL